MNAWIAGLLGAALGGGAALFCAYWVYHRRLTDANRETRDMLERLQKLEQVRSTFVANVTHELKTPLTSIKGYVELLKDGDRDEEIRQSFYEIIDIEAERLHALIDDILQLSEIENSRDDPRQQTAALDALVAEIQDRFRLQAEKAGVTLTVLIPAGFRVRGNPHRLKQILGNLIDNAIKYNKPGGTVLLRAWQESGNAIISVADTGIGMGEEHLAHIFERFYRVDKSRSRELGGTGLGLSIVKHVVHLHGGTVHVDSAPNKGTRFTVKLPD